MTMLSNIDTLEVSYEITNYDAIIAKHADCFEHFKRSASEQEDNRAFINLFGSSWYILGTGVRHYAYIFHNDDLEIRFARYRSSNLENYPVQVKFKSKFLWSAGYKQAIIIVENLLSSNLGAIMGEKVSRVDLCCHTDEFIWSESDINRFLGKYRKDNIYRYGRKVNGFTFGTGSNGIMCRIYDKILEIKQSSDKLWFYDVWLEGNMFMENIWNIEFELRRDFLREIKCNSLDDLTAMLGDLWQYCTSQWLVLKDLTATRLERCEVNFTWSRLQGLFADYEGLGMIKRQKQITSMAATFVPSLLGYLTSYVSCLDSFEFYSDLPLALHMAFESCKKYLKDNNRDIKNDIKRKRALRIGLGVMSA